MAARASSPLPVAAALAATALLLAACHGAQPPTLSSTTSAPSRSAPGLAPTDDSDSQVGGLVDGFPTDLLPVPAGAQVLVSAVQPVAGGLRQVSLNVRTSQDTAGLLAAVRAPLIAAGFAEQQVPVPEGLAAQVSFTRAAGEVLVVGIRDDGTTRTMSVGGTVAAA